MNRNKQVCGRITEGQLDFHHTDILVTINSLSHKERNTNFAFYLLSIGTLLMASTNNLEAREKPSITSKTSIQPSELFIDSLHPRLYPPKKIKGGFGGGSTPYHGQVSYPIYTEPDPEKIYTSVEQMPEFDGGYDSLINFITSNLKYPEWERQNKIEGIVYVGFTINKDGSISDIRINVSVAGSKNFDAEVIRVISSIPKWIPGENNGKKVRVRYHLPVRFKL
jgi:TonB family protein